MPGSSVTVRSALSPGPISLVCCSSIPLPSILSECTTLPTFTALNTYAPDCCRVISDGSKLISVSFTWITSIGFSATVGSPAATDGGASSCSSLPPPVSPPPPQPTAVPNKSKQIHPTTACLNFIETSPISGARSTLYLPL